MTDHYDVIIAGGGCVGATLACALGDVGLRVALVESRSLAALMQRPAGIDPSVYAITRVSQRLFESLNVWPDILSGGVSPYREMHVWDAQGDGEIDFDSAAMGIDNLGYIIEQGVIQRALYQRIQQHATISLLEGVQVVSIQKSEDQVQVSLTNKQSLTAHLLVAADGRDSLLRELAGIDIAVKDYQQHAVVTVVQTEYSHQAAAWQRFLPTGPLAFLPLAEGQSSIVWSTTPEQAADLIAMDDEAFKQILGEAFDHRLGTIETTGKRFSFPLHRQHAESYIAQRVCLIGDAAHGIHPLAGQGLNLGLLDVESLADIIADTHVAHRDIGSERVLKRYQRARRGGNLAMMTVMDGFKELFGSEQAGIVSMRNAGLTLVNKLGPLKNLLARYAMEADLNRGRG